MRTATKILVLGNSHTDAIKRASGNQTGISVHWLKNAKSIHGDTEIDAAHDMVAALTPDDCLVILHLGALHNVIGLLNHEQPFALANGAPDTSSTTLIPDNLMQAMMLAQISRKSVITMLTEKAPCPSYHVMSPPPKETLIMPTDTGKAYRGASIQEMGFSPAPQRLAMWQLEENTIAQYLKTIGVNHIGAVPGTQTAEGYLHPDYHATDNTHANAAYGAKVIEHLQSLMTSA